MDKAEPVFNSFNTFMSESFEKLIEEQLNNLSAKEVENNLGEITYRLKEFEEIWYRTPINELGNITPKQYFEDKEDLNELVDIFKQGALICDENLPQGFLNKLKSFGSKVEEILIRLATDENLIDTENYLIPVMAMKTLGEWKTTEGIKPLIQLILRCENKPEIIKESIWNTLDKIGTEAIYPIIECLNTSDKINDPHEYLLLALARIGVQNRSDTIFKCLKGTFVKMENKIYGAICLGEYGDPRAIPALRGYVEKNISTIDKDLFYEIKSAVIKLGGNMNDMCYHE